MIRIDYTNGQGIATNAYPYSCNATGNFSALDSFNTLNICDFLTVDGDGIDLSGTKQFANDNVYQGIYSGLISNSTDYLYTNTYVEYEGDFSDIATTGITVTFYHTNITQAKVRAYHDDTQIGYVVNTSSGMTKFFDFSNQGDLSTCNKIRIYDIKTNKNNARFHIENIAKGNVSRGTFEDIKSHNLIEEINILSTDLPCNQFEAIVAAKIKPAIDSKINVYSNDKYYGTFWINEVEQVGKKLEYDIPHGEWIEHKVVGNDLYSITAVNAVALLDRGNFRKWRASCFVDMSGGNAEFVGWAGVRYDEFIGDMQNATGVQVVSTDANYNDSSSDEYHSKLGLYGYINRQSYRYNLCAMAYALGYMIDASRNNKVVFKRIPSTVTKTYTNNDIIGMATFSKVPKITKIEYYTYPDAKVAQIGEISISTSADPYSKDNTYWFSMPTALSEAMLDYEFGSIAIEDRNGNAKYDTGNSTTAPYYRVYADRTIYKNGTPTNWLRFPLELSPKIETLTVQTASEDNSTDHNYFTVQGVKNISTITDTSTVFYWAAYKQAFTGTKLNRQNPIRKMAKSGGTVNAKVILTDEKVGDLVTITTDFGEQITGIITKMSIHFGYNDVADIEVTQYE